MSVNMRRRSRSSYRNPNSCPNLIDRCDRLPRRARSALRSAAHVFAVMIASFFLS